MAEKATMEIDSAARVALELAIRISNAEIDTTKDRAYWLKLYSDCLKVVHHRDPQKVLES